MKKTTPAQIDTNERAQFLFTRDFIEQIDTDLHNAINSAITATIDECCEQYHKKCQRYLKSSGKLEKNPLSDFFNPIANQLSKKMVSEKLASLYDTKKTIDSFIITYAAIEKYYKEIEKNILEYRNKKTLYRKVDKGESLQDLDEKKDILYEIEFEQQTKFLEKLNEIFYSALYKIKNQAEQDPTIGKQIKNINRSDVINAISDKDSNKNQQSCKSSIFNYLYSLFQPKTKDNDNDVKASKLYKP